MYQKIILCEDVKGYDLNKFFKEKGIVKAQGVDFTTDDFFKPLQDCALNVRIVNAMRIQDIRCIGELLQYPVTEFIRLRHFGSVSVTQIRDYVLDHYPSINLGGLNHVMSLFWSFRDVYLLPNNQQVQAKSPKITEVEIKGYCIPVNLFSNIKIVSPANPKDEYCETIIIEQIYQNGSRSKTPINVRLLLGMTANEFIKQFNKQCNDLWMDELKIKQNK